MQAIQNNVRLLERLTILPADVPTVPGSAEHLLLQGEEAAVDRPALPACDLVSARSAHSRFVNPSGMSLHDGCDSLTAVARTL